MHGTTLLTIIIVIIAVMLPIVFGTQHEHRFDAFNRCIALEKAGYNRCD